MSDMGFIMVMSFIAIDDHHHHRIDNISVKSNNYDEFDMLVAHMSAIAGAVATILSVHGYKKKSLDLSGAVSLHHPKVPEQYCCSIAI
jgi:hypothetical protein